MSNYFEIEHNLRWDNIVPKIEPEICALLLRENDCFLVGWGVKDKFTAHQSFSFIEFEKFKAKHSGNYLFGFLGYDIKNQIEPILSSNNQDLLDFPLSYMFVPNHVILYKNGKLTYCGDWQKKDLENWLAQITIEKVSTNKSVSLQPLTEKTDYLRHIKNIQKYIQRGDIYETNFCINFVGEAHQFNSFQTFVKANKRSVTPFSAYFNLDFGAIMSSSPERFLLMRNRQLISQPIKGTAPRSNDSTLDQNLKTSLQNDQKERAENIMIVDLVRNDLSKIAEKNSVLVTELCNIYSFENVHQMISTVQCQLKNDSSFSDILRATFPMGSMTGAPKISAMKIAENEENFKRSAYSGAMGVIHPNGNFDFNVIIRTILYNSQHKLLSVAAGGAITIKSDPEKEFQECLTKLQAIREVLC